MIPLMSPKRNPKFKCVLFFWIKHKKNPNGVYREKETDWDTFFFEKKLDILMITSPAILL